MKVLLYELIFENDPAQIGPYIKKRLGQDDFLSILSNEGVVRSPMDHFQMRRMPATTLKIERSFSMLKQVVRDNRNFCDDNVEKVFMCYYNSIGS